MSTHEVAFYVRLKAEKSVTGKILSVKAAGLFQGPPGCDANERAVKVRCIVPDTLFDYEAHDLLIERAEPILEISND